MRLAWTRPAVRHRALIRAYISQEDSVAARRLDELILGRAARLREFPELGRPGRVPGTRELVVHPNYVLVYDVAGDLVRILALVHTARNWPPAT